MKKRDTTRYSFVILWHEKQNVTVKRKHLLNLREKKRWNPFCVSLEKKQDEVERTDGGKKIKIRPTVNQINNGKLVLAPTQQNAFVNIKYLYKRE